ncbi:MAG: hypothetical protein GX593_01110 [Actinomycetales bacterium]|nr:hypothetical protein [Actinomycetales bacterium]
MTRGAVALLAVVALGAGAVWGVVTFLRSLDAEPRAKEQCTATNDGVRFALSHEQADHAALLVASTLRRGMPARAATIAIATAMQESSLRNLDYGDRDSLGLFQQRPSQGWGSEEEIMDPVYSTDAFLEALGQVDGYEQMEITVAAQTVQRSAFPDAYAQHEPMSRAWASALTGHSPATMTCVVHEPGAGSTTALIERVERDLGDVGVEVADGEGPASVTIDASVLAGAGGEGVERLAWAVGQWAVALSAPLNIAEVTVADSRWGVTDAAWAAVGQDDAPPAPGLVRVTLHG